MSSLVINDDVKAAIHQLIAIDGLDFKYVANLMQISEIECRRLYREAKTQAIEQHKTKSLYIREVNDQLYERIIHQANEAFERSKKPKITKLFRETTEKNKLTDSGDSVVENVKTLDEQKTEGQVGDPRFLAIQIDAADKRSKLHGADAPKKIEVEKKTTVDMYLEIDAMPLEERQRLANEFALLQQRGVLYIEEEQKETLKS